MPLFRFAVLSFACACLVGCTFFFDVTESAPDPGLPDAQGLQTLTTNISKIVATMKEASRPEISVVGENSAQSGPEKWTICVRASFPEQQTRYFTFFIKGSYIKDWRPAVIKDYCEARAFSVLNAATISQ